MSFTRAEGLQLAPEPARMARLTIAKLQLHPVKTHGLDARRLEGVNGFNVFCLLNPFSNLVQDGVLKPLTAQAGPRQERIGAYNNATDHRLMRQHGCTPMRRSPGFWGHGIGVYSNQPKRKPCAKHQP